MGARLKFWRRSRVPKKGSRDEAVEIVFLAASPLVTAPPSNLTRLYYNGSAAKCDSTTTKYRQLRRLLILLSKNSFLSYQNEAVMKTVKFYNVCLDEASVNRRGDAPLKDLIDRMGGWNVTGNMTPLSTMNIAQRIGKITSELFIKPFINVKVFYDPHDSSKHIIQVRTTVVWLQLDSPSNSPVRRASGCKL